MTAPERKQPLVRIYGRLASPEAYRLRDFLHRSDVPFEFIPLESGTQPVSRARSPSSPGSGTPPGLRPRIDSFC
jgi:hypothetical protein